MPRSPARDLDLARALADRDLDRPRYLAFARDHYLADHDLADHARYLAEALVRVLDSARDRAPDLAKALALDLADRDLDLARYLAEALARDLADRDLDRVRDLAEARDHALDLALDLARALELVEALMRAQERGDDDGPLGPGSKA